MPRLALYSLVICALAVAAAIVSFARGAGSGHLGPHGRALLQRRLGLPPRPRLLRPHGRPRS
ncbi:hypothetical protein NKH77_15215 [Streptomyces sp. M19]